jgi:hypothetical protein
VKLWTSVSTGDHELAVELQKFDVIDTQEESSREPTLIKLRSAFSSTNDITGDPQFSQKPLVTCEPSLPVEV